MYVLHTTLICTGANVIHCQQWLHCDYHKALSAFTSSMPVHTTPPPFKKTPAKSERVYPLLHLKSICSAWVGVQSGCTILLMHYAVKSHFLDWLPHRQHLTAFSPVSILLVGATSAEPHHSYTYDLTVQNT